MGRSIKRRMSGRLLRGGVWHIDKVIHGTRVCESTGTSDLEEAEALLMRLLQAARATRLFGAREEHKFREAATKYLYENQQAQPGTGCARVGDSRSLHRGTPAATCSSRHIAGFRAGATRS